MITFLIGMPGVGKSYWGQRVAAHFGWSFIDLDIFIATGECMSVPQLFANIGEVGFRKLEHEYLQQAIGAASQDTVIACGGGTPCFHGNMQWMQQAGRVVYLQAEPQYLYENLLRSSETRPLLTDDNALLQLETLMAQRAVFYEAADYILQAKDISLTTFEKIMGYV